MQGKGDSTTRCEENTFVGDVWLCVCHWQSPIPLNLTLLDKCQHWQDGRQYQGVWSNIDFQAVDIFRDVWTITEDLDKLGVMKSTFDRGIIVMKFEQIGIARRVVKFEYCASAVVCPTACFNQYRVAVSKKSPRVWSKLEIDSETVLYAFRMKALMRSEWVFLQSVTGMGRRCLTSPGLLAISNGFIDRTPRPHSQLPPTRPRISKSMLWESSSSLMHNIVLSFYWTLRLVTSLILPWEGAVQVYSFTCATVYVLKYWPRLCTVGYFISLIQRSYLFSAKYFSTVFYSFQDNSREYWVRGGIFYMKRVEQFDRRKYTNKK